MRIAIWLVFFLLGTIVTAQVDGVPRDLIEQRIEAAVEQLGGDSDVDLTNLFEVLTDRYLDPIVLNHTDAQELNSLLLLSDLQINSILQHIHRNGKLLSIYELQTVPAMDANTIALVRPFVTVRENPLGSTASLREIFKNGTHELTVRSTTNVEQRKGFMHQRNIFGQDYRSPNGSELPDLGDPSIVDSLERTNRVYLGSPYRLYTRYRFRYRHNISFGFTAEKDEGEEFFRGTQKNGFDFYSAHLFIRDVGRFKSIAIGDYSAQFGQGLTFWNGLAFASKSSFTMNVKRNAVGLMPYTSVNENLFMRGAAATYSLTDDLELTGFVSLKKLDANVTAQIADDTLGTAIEEVIITSFQEDGFHRTYSELEKKGAVDENVFGGHLRYKQRSYSIGLTAAHVRFDTDLRRNVRPYNQFEFNGSENTTAGVDWNVLHRNLNWFGEVSRSANDAIAMNTGILVALDRRVSMSLLYRNYGRNFQGLYSVAFAEGTNPWNERGLYTGIEVRPNRYWSINAYFDQFRFPWLRYLTDAPSQGSDWMAQVNWKPSKRVELYVRARHQHRARNSSEPVTGVKPVVGMAQINHRFNATYRVSDAVTLRTRIETVDFKKGEAPLEHGYLLYQDLIHRPLMSPVELTLRFALFQTDSYDARIYAYENDITGFFSIPPHYGRGIRWYGMIRANPIRNVDLWFKYGAWIYMDQTSISSGLQEVAGNKRSDIRLQLRWRF
jgi:hypothetical protein